jgi:spore maturation protein CgeB
MHIAFFGHSVLADWGNGRAHFFRGLIRELTRLGHQCVFYEARDNWASRNQCAQIGQQSLLETLRAFPFLKVRIYHNGTRDPLPFLRQVLTEADVVFVSQWSEPALIRGVPEVLGRRQVSIFYDDQYGGPFEEGIYRSYNLERYGRVLACSQRLAGTMRERLNIERVEVFVEAADTDLFYPRPCRQDVDALLIANGGEGREPILQDYFLEQSLLLPHLRFCLYGVRYGDQARQQFRTVYRVDYRGWAPNSQTPPLYARSRLALHLFREPFVTQLSGVPTIRPFEAFATRTCLVTSPWEDEGGLFREGEHYLRAQSPEDMTNVIRYLLENRPARERVAEAGYRNLLARHTCRHRAEQLLQIIAGCAQAAA